MTMILTKRYKSYRFGLSSNLADKQLDNLIRLFGLPTGKGDSVLGGRSSVTIAELEGAGSVVIKYYTRGGLVRYFVKQRYLRWGKTRCQVEYEMLCKVRRVGVGAPEPVAFIRTGGLFYKAWLVTREIKHQQSLAELSRADENRARIVMKKLLDQISILINSSILHIDLHPGNVLVNRDDRVFLVDFDKARVYRGNKNRLRDRYIKRWRRAVIKHHLPEILLETMRAGLQKNYQ
ncbi:MAG: hypothetical protein BA868_06745 [Desulfobacterales bacterium C00003106]|nr:MAG: hypothetical protein BA868_06745 [Desulfobacterales bacterium C00003106]OEU58798.1 MAG: hypothetical protein BAW33_09090 [Desulfobacterales bacterium C00003104]